MKWAALVLVVGIGVGGCAEDYRSELRDAARYRAMNEFVCRWEHLRVRELGSGAYEVQGCHRAATYACVQSGHIDGVTCIRER